MIKVLVFFDLNKTSGYGHLYRFQKFKKIFPKDSNFYTVNSKFDSFIQRNKEFFDYGFIDSYNINYSVEKKIKKICKKLIVIDDLCNRKFAGDVIINYSPVIQKKKYLKKINSNTKLLIGNKFNFVKDYTNVQKNSPSKKFKVFIYLGKKKRNKETSYIINKIKKRKFFGQIFLLGNNKPQINHKNFLNKISRADILIVSSGITLQEGLSQKKIIFSDFFSDNQKPFFEYYIKKKLIFKISDFANFICKPKKEINELILKQKNNKRLFNQYDATFNVKRKIIKIFDRSNNLIHFKNYNKNYSKKLFSLQTEENRKYFKNKKTFSYKSHKEYLHNFLAREGNFIFIIMLKKKFAGYLKLELLNEKFFTSILIHKSFRNNGVATKVLKYVNENNLFGKRLFAEIDKKNKHSVKAFKKANFKNKDLKFF